MTLNTGASAGFAGAEVAALGVVPGPQAVRSMPNPATIVASARRRLTGTRTGVCGFMLGIPFQSG